MPLSGDERELVRLSQAREIEQIFRKHQSEIGRLKQLAVRSGPARGALDRLYVDIIDEVLETRVNSLLAAYRRDETVPSDADIQEIVQDLSRTASGIWHGQGHQPLPSSQDGYQGAVPRARQLLIIGAKELARDLKRSAQPVPAAEVHTPQKPAHAFVDASRLNELRQLKSAKFDLTRLIALCEELNLVSSVAAHHATAMLVRSVIDHVPPIFGVPTFAQVASNYSGSKSFKEAMAALETAARKISDAHLHTQIRARETLPNATQVNFAPQLDALLAEIVRTLK